MKYIRNLVYHSLDNGVLKNLWYPLGMMTFSASSIFLLIFITRFFGTIDSGIFAISWAVCQQMYSLGLFGTRNFQIADVEDRYTFSQYYSSKFFSVFLMLLGCVVYSTFLNLSSSKLIMSVLLTILMITEVFADVFAGHMQKMGKNSLIGKSYFFRIIFYDIIIIIVSLLVHDINIAIVCAFLFSFAWILLIDFYYIKNYLVVTKIKFSFNFQKILVECMPILLSAFFTNFIINIPKNAIELYSTNELQAVYNIIFTPTSIIALVSSIIFMPIYTSISKNWYDRKYSEFLKQIKKIIGFITLFTCIIIVIAFMMGIPILSIIYNIDLNTYKSSFLLLVLSGGIVSISWLLVYLLTVFNKQRLLIYIYVLIAILSNLLTGQMVKVYSIMGASMSYFFSSLSINILLIIVVIIEYHKLKK